MMSNVIGIAQEDLRAGDMVVIDQDTGNFRKFRGIDDLDLSSKPGAEPLSVESFERVLSEATKDGRALGSRLGPNGECIAATDEELYRYSIAAQAKIINRAYQTHCDPSGGDTNV